MRLGGRALVIMTDVTKSLAQQLAAKKIDDFIRDYQLSIRQRQLVPSQDLELAHSKWVKITQSIDNLLGDMPTPSKGWLVHSTRTHQMAAAANRSNGKFEVKYSFTLQSGLQPLCKLLSYPQGYKDLLPFCYQSREVSVVDQLEKDVLIKYKAPFLDERIMLLHLLAVDRLDHNNTIVVYGEGATKQDMEALVQKSRVNKGELKGEFVKIKNFAAEIKVTPQEYIVTAYASFHDALSSIPDFVVKKLLQLSSSIIISNLVKILSKKQQGGTSTSTNQELMRCIERRLRLKYPGRL